MTTPLSDSWETFTPPHAEVTLGRSLHQLVVAFFSTTSMAYYYFYYQFFQRRVTQNARLPVQGGPLVHKYNTHSTIQNKIMNKHYTITNKQMLYKTNTIQWQ